MSIIKEPAKKRVKNILIKVKNNTNQDQPIVLFDIVNAYRPNAILGVTTYTWDLTTELSKAVTNSLFTIVVLATGPANTIYQQYIYNTPGEVPFADISEVLTGLNSLGIGTFYIVSGNTVAIDSDTYVFASVNLTETYTASHQLGIGIGTEFTTGGSLIYDPGYTSGLVGTFTRISLANSFWKNISGSYTGPYNRSSIYVNKGRSIQLGLFANVNVASAKTVYIGFSFSRSAASVDSSNFGELYLNGVKIIDLPDNTALNAVAANVNAGLGTAYTNSNISFVVWSIIPVSLIAGNNLIQFSAKGNINLDVMGLEVYDNTAAEIAAATSASQLNVLFSSIDYVGQLMF